MGRNGKSPCVLSGASTTCCVGIFALAEGHFPLCVLRFDCPFRIPIFDVADLGDTDVLQWCNTRANMSSNLLIAALLVCLLCDLELLGRSATARRLPLHSAPCRLPPRCLTEPTAGKHDILLASLSVSPGEPSGPTRVSDWALAVAQRLLSQVLGHPLSDARQTLRSQQ